MSFSKGDIVLVNFNPTKGHEQGNYRPAVVINSVPLPGDLNIVLPITTKQKTYPLEVELDNRTKTTGVILCFQIKTIDLNARNATVVDKLPDDLLQTCSEYVGRLIGEIN